MEPEEDDMAGSHMESEVAEAPEAVARLLDGSRGEIADAAGALRAMDPRLLVTVARGSSDHACAYLKYALEIAAGLPVASLGPSVASVYGRTPRLDGAACLAVSQSGQSPDIVAMLRAARTGGALTVALTNVAGSPLAEAAHHSVALRAGPERSVAATKTWVASVAAGLALLAEWRDDADLRAAVAGLPDALGRALALDWSPLADRLVGASSAYVVGRGPAFAVAGEAGLKLKETCGIHAEAFSAAEVLHGPAALARDGLPVLALAVEDAARAGVMATAEQFAGQGADVFVTGASAEGCAMLPSVGGLHPLLASLPLIVGLYGIVPALARARGHDPDRPAHLMKVTETT